MDYRKIHQYITLHQRREKAAEELKKLSTEMTTMENHILAEMQAEEVERLSMAGFQIYIHEDIKATVLVPKEEISLFHRAIRKAKLGYMVKESVNIQTLKAFIRERRTDNKNLPRAIEQLIEVEPVYSVKIKDA